MKLSVGIVMRTKNRAVLLKRALESVLNQTYTNWHLVVVNDGGEIDPVEKLLTQYHNQWHNRIHVIHNPQSYGLAKASNLGLDYLNTDLAIIHDDDDSWSPDFLLCMTQTYIEQKQKFPNIGGIVCHTNKVIEEVEGNIIHIGRLEDYTQWMSTGLLPLKLMLNHNQFPTIGFLFELITCKELGMYDENLPVLEEWDFHVRFMLNKDIWVLTKSLAFYHHRLNATGSLGNSVIAGVDKHNLYRIYLENKWLRQDLVAGQFGAGAMVGLISMLKQ